MTSYFRQVPNFDYVNRNEGENQLSNYITVKNLFKRGKIREDIFKNVTFFEKYTIVGDERPDNVAFKFYNEETLDWLVLLANNIINVQTEWPIPQRIFESYLLDKYGDYETLYNGIHHYETIEVKDSKGVTVLKEGLRVTEKFYLEYYDKELTITNSASALSIQSGGLGYNNGLYNDVYLINAVGKTSKGKGLVCRVIVNNNTISSVEIIDRFDNNPYGGSNYKVGDLLTIPLPNDEPAVIRVDSIKTYRDKVKLANNVTVPITNYQYEFDLNDKKRNIFILKPRYLNVIFNDMDELMPYKKGSQQYVSENLKKGDNIRLYD